MNKLKDTIKTIVLAAYYSFRLCWRHDKLDTFCRIVLTIMQASVGYVSLLIMGELIDVVQQAYKGSHDEGEVTKLFFWLMFVMVTGIFIRRANWFVSNRFRINIKPANMEDIIVHQGTLDVARIRSQEYDDLEKRIQELPAGWSTRFYFTEELFGMLSIVSSFLMYSWTIFTGWPYLGLILAVASVPMVISKFRIIGRWWSLSQELAPNHKQRSVIHRPFHNDKAFVQAKMFNQMASLKKLARENWAIILGHYDKLRLKTVMGELLSSLISVAGLGIVLWILTKEALLGITAIGTLTVAAAASRAFRDGLAEFVGLLADQWNSAKGVILIEKEYFGLKPFLITENPVYPKFERPPTIRITNLSFAYQGMDSLVLKNISLVFEPGTVNAIVGESGEGKSTLISLIARHYDPTSGSIHFGDINSRNIPPEGMADVLSGMTQDTVILERKIGEEIASSRLGEPVDQDKVMECARFALFDEVITGDAKGLDSQIGVEFGGRDFSGGEKKRLALARVRYRNTPILILDEPDSSLDPKKARKVLDNIFALRGKVTVILVTHHVSITQECDKVIVISSGEVAEQGNPAELLAQNGKYTAMFSEDKKRRKS